MSDESDEDKELEEIREKKMEEMMNEGEDSGVIDAPIKVNDSTFDEVIKEHPLIVIDCWAEWCGPCRMLGPIIDTLAKDLSGKVVFGKLNVDENQRTAMQFKIMSIPSLLVFKDGSLIDTIVGAMPKEALEPKLTKYL
ncbi:MAG: thioredoxin [Halobacteriota archaeon]|nr:thioredoxin [Halobacteriota archaeon]